MSASTTTPNSDSGAQKPAARKPRKWTTAHYIVMTIWFTVAIWLCVPVAVAVIGNVFFGPGPVETAKSATPTAQSAPVTTPATRVPAPSK